MTQSAEELPAPTDVMDSGAQPSTIFTDFNEAEEAVEEPFQYRKRKRNTTNIDYLAVLKNVAESNESANEKTGWTMKGKQFPTWKSDQMKHGVPIGVWKLSDEPVDERKHVVFGFLDPKFALRGRKYRERKDGSKYIGNFPSGTGTWAVKLSDWILDPHLKGFTRKELTEYVRIRVKTWREGEDPEERDARDKSAVADAKATAAATESTFQSEHKGNSARKSKNNTPRKSNEGKLSNGIRRGSFGEPSPSASREPRMDFSLSMSPNGTPSSIGPPSKLGMSPRERSKYVIKGRDVLIGYWKDSSEIKAINKHAMYGVIQAHGVFRVKVVPETRDGRSTIGNYPASTGGCWVNYDTCVLEEYLKDLTRTEIEEYCRICVVDPDYGEGNQGTGIDRAVQEAKRIVAEKAAAKGQNIIEYNRERVDQLESWAFARQVEKRKKRGELVHTPLKVDVKPTARRSDKATSDARAQKLRLARKEAKEAEEAKERQTANLRGDSDLSEAMRRSGEDREPPRAQSKHGRYSDVTPAMATGNGAEASCSRHAKGLTNAYGHLSQVSSTTISDKNGVNGGEAEGGKFYQLDRDAQRAKMEKWCSQKPTSRYHRLQGEERKRHIERHIDQKIEAQTGIATAHRPKKRSRTGACPAASPARPGAVSVPSPLARSVSANLQAPVTPAASEVAVVHGSLVTESPAAQQMTTQLSLGNIKSNLALRSLLNSPATPTSGSTVAPQPKPVENTADVQMAGALVEASLPPVTSNSNLSIEPVQNEPSAVTTQPTPMKNAPDVPMIDAPVKVTKTAPPLTSHLTPPAESSPLPASTAKPPTAPIAPVESVQPAKASPLLQTQGVIITPKSGAPTAPYTAPYPQPQQTPDATPARILALPTQQFVAATPPSAPAPQSRPAPQIVEGDDDGLKYRKHPRGRFAGLFVSMDRNVADIGGAEYVQQFVLVAMGRKREKLVQGEKMVDNNGVEMRVAMNGKFEGLLVGVKRMVTAVDWEDYMKFIVAVPA